MAEKKLTIKPAKGQKKRLFSFFSPWADKIFRPRRLKERPLSC